ncbi:MAG: hypothetical protein U9N10_10395 [Bacillota bacterium]|nr:hypothetical protein [Bacillota bacterium]
MKNRILILLLASLLLVSCRLTTIEQNEKVIIENEEEVTKENDFEAWTLGTYFGIELQKLNEEQKLELSIVLDQINELEAIDNEDDYEKIDNLYFKLENIAIEYGLSVPLYSYSDVVYKYDSMFTNDQGKKIIELDGEYNRIYESSPDNQDALDRIQEDIDKIITDVGLSAIEILNQVETRSIHLARFNIINGEIEFRKDFINHKKNISEMDIKRYKKMWEHIRKIIPKDYMNMIKIFVINTDGYGNIMAFVNQENDDLSTWRLVIDIKDALDENGEFNEEFTGTVIHEFAHVLTLNSSEIDVNNIEEVDTFIVEEGRTNKNSYMNLFYQKFWNNIYEEHQELLNNADSENYDITNEFYEKYEDQFVSDYAATNPGEDIAETFRIFVLEDKPVENLIKDKKILFMYEFEELVKIRDEIRNNLEIE